VVNNILLEARLKFFFLEKGFLLVKIKRVANLHFLSSAQQGKYFCLDARHKFRVNFIAHLNHTNGKSQTMGKFSSFFVVVV